MDTPLLTPPSPPPAAPPAPMPSPAAGPPPRRTRHAAHIVAIVIGCLLLLPGLGMAAGGAAAAAGPAWATDDDGFFEATLERVESDGTAIAATDLWLTGNVDDVDDGPTWLLELLDVEIRLSVTGADTTDDVFVGIARSADVDRYLAGAAHSDVVDIDHRTARYEHVPGADEIQPPTEQEFWSASTSGPGEQELTWEARGGRWSVLVMNADGTPGVAADVEVGVRSDAVVPIAVTLIVLGGLVVTTGVVLVVVGARGRRPSPGPDGTRTPGPLPPPAGNVVD